MTRIRASILIWAATQMIANLKRNRGINHGFLDFSLLDVVRLTKTLDFSQKYDIIKSSKGDNS